MLLTLLAYELRKRGRSDPSEECARGGRVEGFSGGGGMLAAL